MRAMRRREFLTLGAVATGVFYLGGLGLAGRSLARAAQLSIPTVDRLVLTNVVDNVYDIFSRGGLIGNVSVQRTSLGEPQLLSEHGLAFHLESFRGEERREILLDFALTERSLFNNYGRIGVEPAAADALILSHGHADHFGDLPHVAGLLPAWRERQMTLYAGSEDSFCRRWTALPDGTLSDLGQLDQRALEAQGLTIALVKEPAVIAGHAITSGRIDRVTDFETVPPSARLEAGEITSACEPNLHFPPGTPRVEVAPGELVPDIFYGEIATAYHVKDRGLVVVSSCGHAGIINSVRQLQAVTGVEHVHAIVGGFHLAASPDAVVDRTVEAFAAIDPDYILPMHCSGFNTMVAIQRALPTKLIMPSTGTRVVFGT